MICPHCNKEIDGYVGIKAENINLNPNNGCAGGVLNYTYRLINAAPNNPLPVLGLGSTVLDVTGCANQQLDIHYHVTE